MKLFSRWALNWGPGYIWVTTGAAAARVSLDLRYLPALKWHHVASRFYSVLTQSKYSSCKLFETTFHFRSLNVLFITADEKLKSILTVSSTQSKYSTWHLDPTHFDFGGY